MACATTLDSARTDGALARWSGVAAATRGGGERWRSARERSRVCWLARATRGEARRAPGGGGERARRSLDDAHVSIPFHDLLNAHGLERVVLVQQGACLVDHLRERRSWEARATMERTRRVAGEKDQATRRASRRAPSFETSSSESRGRGESKQPRARASAARSRSPPHARRVLRIVARSSDGDPARVTTLRRRRRPRHHSLLSPHAFRRRTQRTAGSTAVPVIITKSATCPPQVARPTGGQCGAESTPSRVRPAVNAIASPLGGCARGGGGGGGERAYCE